MTPTRDFLEKSEKVSLLQYTYGRAKQEPFCFTPACWQGRRWYAFGMDLEADKRGQDSAPPPAGQAPVAVSRYRKIKLTVLAVVVLITIGISLGLWFTMWPPSDETIVAAYACGEGLSWNVRSGHSTHETYGGAIAASYCEYHRTELVKDGRMVFSVANWTDCRDFDSHADLVNGVDEPFYAGHQAFPAGAPIVAAMTTIDAVIPPPQSEEPFGDTRYQLGFQISTRSGLTAPEFLIASRCILDHRNELHEIFGELHFNSGPLMWLALVDDSAPYAPGDLPGAGQVFACENGYTYRTSGESLFALAPGKPPLSKDEFGLGYINDVQVAVIGTNGRLYEPNKDNPGLAIALPYTDYRAVDEKRLPAPLSMCVNSRNVSLHAYLESLNANTLLYKPPAE